MTPSQQNVNVLVAPRYAINLDIARFVLLTGQYSYLDRRKRITETFAVISGCKNG